MCHWQNTRTLFLLSSNSSYCDLFDVFRGQGHRCSCIHYAETETTHARGLFFCPKTSKPFFPHPFYPFSYWQTFLPLISTPTGFYDWGFVISRALPLITSNYYLPSTTKDRMTSRPNPFLYCYKTFSKRHTRNCV